MSVSPTFGSLGDIIALSLLIKEVVRTLDSSRGSAAEYVQVVADLQDLDKIFIELNSLSQTCENSPEYLVLGGMAQSIAGRCRDCLKEFSEKMKRYEGLGTGSGSGSMSVSLVKQSYLKVHWRVQHKESLDEFRRQVKRHIRAITVVFLMVNIRMSIINNEKSEHRLKEAQKQYQEVDAQLKHINRVVEETKHTCLGQAAASNEAWKSLEELKTTMTGTLKIIFLLSLDTWRKVNAILDRLAAIVSPWTQAPVTLQDALGRVWPIPLELVDSWDFLHTVLVQIFQGMPGLGLVIQGQFILEDTVTENKIHTGLQWKSVFLPGRRVVMTMVLRHTGAKPSASTCPGCSTADYSILDQGVQIICTLCWMLYAGDKAPTLHVKTQNGIIEIEEAREGVELFRRVRIHPSQPPGRFSLMEDWWSCCNCRMNNLASTRDCCSSCGGKRCRDCPERLGG